MIQINLLPYHLRPIKRTPLPYLISAAAFVLAVLAMGATFIATQTRIVAQQKTYAQLEKDLEGLADVVKESNRLVDLKQQLASKLQTIDEIVKDRIIWSRQLWNLARIAPDNCWFSEIKVSEKKISLPGPVDPTTKKPGERINLTVQELQLSGYVVASKDSSSNVSPLAVAAEQDPEFSSLFKPSTAAGATEFKTTEFEDQPVKSFTLEYTIEAEAAPSNDNAGAQGGGQS